MKLSWYWNFREFTIYTTQIVSIEDIENKVKSVGFMLSQRDVWIVVVRDLKTYQDLPVSTKHLH
jgi:hypothetical protein